MRGSVRQRSEGSWQIRYEGPADTTGKRKYLAETFRGTKKEAERVLRERLAAIENGGYVPKQKETVAQFMQRWLDTYAATNTTLRTQQGYRGYVTRYIAPTIGNLPLQGLTARHIQGVYAEMLEHGLSATTIVQLHRILREALSHAIKWGTLTRNVADAATPPRLQRKRLEMWDVDTIHRFLGAAKDSRFKDLYHLAILSGMRRSELTGLQWENVDLLGGKLSVVNTLQRITGHGLVVGPPKTARSRRSIALSPEAVNLLHAIRGRQIEQRLAAGDAWQNTGYVFTQANGTPVAPDMISKDFCAIVRTAGLPHLTFHGLRHAHATLLLTAGVHPKVVSERLGHSNIAITMDTYSHVLPGLQEAAALALDERLARGRRPDTN
ncbi:MAG: site-specific integrase [Dehalococcoidia bacterium]|nr:site-specific integrase [Dehalococcoidia bacterium]